MFLCTVKNLKLPILFCRDEISLFIFSYLFDSEVHHLVMVGMETRGYWRVEGRGHYHGYFKVSCNTRVNDLNVTLAQDDKR